MHEPTSRGVRKASATDRPWIEGVLTDRWGSTTVVSRGTAHDASELPAVVAELGGELAGLLTYRLDGDALEVVTLDATRQGVGVGSALLEEAVRLARASGLSRIWLVTTNDNVAALRFYQHRGFVMRAVHVGAVELSRRLKPSIPQLGADGIPIRDEIELSFDIDLR